MRKLSYKRKKTKSSAFSWVLLAFGLVFIGLSLFILFQDKARYQSQTRVLPAGSTIGGIAVGGMEVQPALQRISEAYAVPVELRYQGARMQFLPQQLGSAIDLSALTEALNQMGGGGSWFAHLWGKEQAESPIELSVEFTRDQAAIENLLRQEVAPRYDRRATFARPAVGQTNFEAGQDGASLDVGNAAGLIDSALQSPNQRVVDLPVRVTQAEGPNWQDLEAMLKQQLIAENFKGLVEVYLADPKTDQTIHFAQRALQDVAVDVAYSGASTIKIPIMVSVLKRTEEPTPNLAKGWMSAMITQSLNPPADALMKTYLNAQTGPLVVMQDLLDLGYENTFLAGYFEPGSPLLRQCTTPANSRRDVYLDPDTYNQTVPSEIGDLLKRMYRCSLDPTQAMFDGAVTQSECEEMMSYLKANQIGALIESGVPPEATVAHKHGWVVALDGYLHTMSDAGVVYTPGGDYVLVIFVHTDEQLIFEVGERIFARLSQSIYNFYNVNSQMPWFGQ